MSNNTNTIKHEASTAGNNLEQYLNKIDTIVPRLFEKTPKEDITYDILDTRQNTENKLIVLREKQRQMNIGKIWQEVIGNYDSFISLKNGHSTGLDVISVDRKIAIEIKNRTNTDNSSSRKTNIEKLAKFKKEHPEYTCIYANINDDTKEKTLRGKKLLIRCNGVEIEHQVGYVFLNFIFEDNTEIVINHVRNILDKYV